MTETTSSLPTRLSTRSILFLAGGALVGVPALLLRATGNTADSVTDAAIFGLGVVGASLLLAWAGEAAEIDIGQAVALAVLALIAVLPEYAVDLALAIKAGGNPARYAPLAAANMTGSNRLLIGIGWALVAFIGIRWCQKNEPGSPAKLELGRDRGIEIAFLVVATLWSLFIPVRHLFGLNDLNLVDAVVFVGIFVFYLRRLSGGTEHHAPDLIGIPAELAALTKKHRRRLLVGMMLFSGVVILAAADPFAESLIHVGQSHGISEFLLIQWVAPLASESPELIIACLFAFRGKGEAGMGALISSKVNQWTLLVGTLPVAYVISALAHGRRSWALPLDNQQVEEFFLTAAQSLMGASILANLNIKRWEAILLFLLFIIQFPFRNTGIRVGMGIVYLLIAAFILVRDRQRIPTLIRILRSKPEPGS